MPQLKKRYVSKKKSARPKRRSQYVKKRRPIYRRTYPRYASMPGLPSIKTVFMPYHQEFVTSASTITYNTFRSNSIYDPDFSGIGHQPRGHDQWALYYKNYRVIACMAKATFFWEEVPSQSHCVGIYLDDNSSFAYSSSLDLYEKEGARGTRQLLSDRTSRIVVKRYVNMSSMTNKSLRDQQTAFGNNPTLAGPYIHVWTLPNNTTVLSYGGVRVHVTLIYKVQLFEPLDISGS